MRHSEEVAETIRQRLRENMAEIGQRREESQRLQAALNELRSKRAKRKPATRIPASKKDADAPKRPRGRPKKERA